jgi:hypothetical protein
LIAVASLIRGQHGRVITGRELFQQLGVSEAATELITNELRRPEILDQRFELDADEFARHARYRTVEMSSGATLTAEERRFDEVFQRELLGAENRVRYSTTGEVVNETLRQQP